jgi:hypothetical protein
MFVSPAKERNYKMKTIPDLSLKEKVQWQQ